MGTEIDSTANGIKNVKRRIYDAINIFIAAKFVEKDGK